MIHFIATSCMLLQNVEFSGAVFRVRWNLVFGLLIVKPHLLSDDYPLIKPDASEVSFTLFGSAPQESFPVLFTVRIPPANLVVEGAAKNPKYFIFGHSLLNLFPIVTRVRIRVNRFTLYRAEEQRSTDYRDTNERTEDGEPNVCISLHVIPNDTHDSV